MLVAHNDIIQKCRKALKWLKANPKFNQSESAPGQPVPVGASPGLDTLVFAGGYLAGWSGYALLAALLQWSLHGRALLRGMQLETGPALAAAILLTAGLYQLTPLKDSCLARCRGPMGFFLANWRDGRLGALRMGLDHGLY